MDDKLETILHTPVETLTEVKCDTHELETMISSLGEIVEVPVVSVPRYTTFHSSIVATGKQGRAPGEMRPRRETAMRKPRQSHGLLKGLCTCKYLPERKNAMKRICG